MCVKWNSNIEQAHAYTHISTEDKYYFVSILPSKRYVIIYAYSKIELANVYTGKFGERAIILFCLYTLSVFRF